MWLVALCCGSSCFVCPISYGSPYKNYAMKCALNGNSNQNSFMHPNKMKYPRENINEAKKP